MPQRGRCKRIGRLRGNQSMNNGFRSDSGLITAGFLMKECDPLMMALIGMKRERVGDPLASYTGVCD